MTAHHAHCDGWHFVGKGDLPDPEDDSVPCTGQCVATWAEILSEVDNEDVAPQLDSIAGAHSERLWAERIDRQRSDKI
jgi:hypothetical protein